MKRKLLILITLFFGVAFSAAADINSENLPEQASEPEAQGTAPSNGWVKLSFEISEYGIPENIKVLESSHLGFFDQEAIRALSIWKYKPKIVDGKPVRQLDMFVQLDFELEGES